MARAAKLRVGRCDCIVHAGRLFPERITVAYRGGKKRRGRLRKRTFIIQEIPIPDRSEAEARYRNRVHVFFDSHPRGEDNHYTFLELSDIVPANGGGEYSYIFYRGESEVAVPRLWREWDGGPFPSLDARTAGLIRLLQRWNRRVPFGVWLRRMTPKGRRLPAADSK